MTTSRRILCWIALTIAVAACQSGPPTPLLSPFEPARRFGYQERQIDVDRFEVSYIAPSRRLVTFATKPTPSEARPIRAQAIDFALWHAAQIARAKGFAGFRVTDRQTDIDSHPEPVYASPEWGAGSTAYWRYPGGLTYGPSGFYTEPFLRVQAHATMTVQLVNALQPGDEDATAVIDRMRAAYPGEDAPPVAVNQPGATSPRL